MSSSTGFVLTMLSLVLSALILVGAYIANGAEREDAWLYMVALLLVVHAGYQVYSMKKGKGK